MNLFLSDYFVEHPRDLIHVNSGRKGDEKAEKKTVQQRICSKIKVAQTG